MSMAKMFMSYKRSRINEVTHLVGHLQARGLDTWRDIEDLDAGRPTEDEVREAIRQSGGFMLYLSKDVEDSDFIKNVEIPAALEACRDKPGYVFYPMFEDMSFAEAKQKTLCLFNKDLTVFNATLLPRLTNSNWAEVDSALGKAAQSVLKASVRASAKSLQTGPIRVHLESYLPASSEQDPHFNINLIYALKQMGLGSRAFWDSLALQGLDDLKCALAECKPREIEVWSQAHISLGIAFGFAFAKTGGSRILSHQYDDIWRSDDVYDKDAWNWLHVDYQSGDVGADYASIELLVSRDVGQEIARYSAKNGLNFRTRCIISPKAGASRDCLSGGPQAVAIANQVVNAIDKLRNERNVRTIHLFAAVPISLAIIVGHNLNACGPIQVYDWDKNSGSYVPVWLLA